jgi:hypothetical protein
MCGEVPKWSNGADCKSVGAAFEGSNPSLSTIYVVIDAGWSSLVARRAHNPEVVGSNPTPATNCVVIDAGWSSLVARRAHNPEVVGSNPAPATKFLGSSCPCSSVGRAHPW